MLLKSILSSLLFFIPLSMFAQGFDDSYAAYSGDFNSDGLTDIYISGNPQPELTPLVIDDLIILAPTGTAVDDFVLVQTADQNFQLHTQLTSAQQQTLAQWPLADIALIIRDFNVDGVTDLWLKGLSNEVSNALDHIVYASRQNGTVAPTASTAVDLEFQRFFADSYNWILNPDYFEDNKAYHVVGTEPASKTWTVALPNNSTPALITMSLNLCTTLVPGADCAISTTDPDICVRDVFLRNEQGDVIGISNEDVCLRDAHIYAYTPGSVTLQADYSHFNQDALELIHVFGDIWQSGEFIPNSPELIAAGEILERILGVEIFRGVFGKGSYSHDIDENPFDEISVFPMLLASLQNAPNDPIGKAQGIFIVNPLPDASINKKTGCTSDGRFDLAGLLRKDRHGKGRQHKGVDLGTSPIKTVTVGTPVVAAANGTLVRYEKSPTKGWGDAILIYSAAGTWSVYAHLDSFNTTISNHSPITAGTNLGTVGRTGYDQDICGAGVPKRTHLHFETMVPGAINSGAEGQVDPQNFFTWPLEQ